MAHLRSFSAFDLLRFNNVNLDPLTETYNMGFYLQYLAKWPDICFTAEAPGGRAMGYILGKAESFRSEGPDSWHGHVTAVTVPAEYRRLGMATQLMGLLEQASERVRGFFVDLFVRSSNAVAIDWYEKMGYVVYRRVIDTQWREDLRRGRHYRETQRASLPYHSPPVYPDDID